MSIEKVVAVPPQHEAALTSVNSSNIYSHEAFRPRLWRAYKGAEVYEVANVWSDEADVELIWQAPRGLALKNTISMRDSFANVMNQLLNQYEHAPFNLQGILSLNPENSRPQLIVVSRP